MNQDEVERVRKAFADGTAAKLRLATGHTIYDCGEAAGISGEAWWKFEHGTLITAHRAPLLAAVLRRMRNGERLEAGSSTETGSAPPVVEDDATKRVRHERDLLVAAEAFMHLSPADLVAAAPTWDSEPVRQMRAAAGRVLRRRIGELGVETPVEASL
jgi:hypothetical protein